MRLLWTVKQLSALLYDWRTELHGLPHHERAMRERRDQERARRMLRRKGVHFTGDGRSIKVTTASLRELFPELWSELASRCSSAGCPDCGAVLECTVCDYSTEDAA